MNLVKLIDVKGIKTCLFTTDVSAFSLPLPLDGLRVVCPTNRVLSEKVRLFTTFCDDRNIPYTFQAKKENAIILDSEGLEPYMGISGDVGVSWFYTMLFDTEILRRMPIVNFHAGPRGPHALRKAIENKDKKIRCMWFWVDDSVDAGKIITEQTIDLPSTLQEARSAIIAVGRDSFIKKVLSQIY